MGTPYSDIIKLFLDRVEKDRDFFSYFNIKDEDAIVLAQTRAQSYLEEATNRIMIECQPTVDFSDKDDTLGVFGFFLTAQERFLIPSLMFEAYLSRYIGYLKIKAANYTASEIRVFDPSRARDSFMEMYRFVCEQNKAYLEMYNSKDRVTNEYLGINYTNNNADENE